MKFLITCLPLSYILRISFNKFLKYTWPYYFTKITDTSRLFYLHALDDLAFSETSNFLDIKKAEHLFEGTV